VNGGGRTAAVIARRTAAGAVACGVVLLATSAAYAQATSRPCTPEESAGPACLLARQQLAKLPSGPLYWHIDRYASDAGARRAAERASTIVDAFGAVWLFTIERKRWQPKHGRPVAVIGPLPVERGPTLAADYLRSVFTPGMTAPLHVHSGPEAFFAVTGDTCLETPEGTQVGRGPGNSLLIKAGPPMLLMAIGKEPRRGFALILHDASKPPTTLTEQWSPEGSCARQLAADRLGS
jgi:quercetin dioxygenase-like cupin family protein